MLATALINLAMASFLTGELPTAERHAAAGLALARARGQRREIGHGLIVQSELAHAAGDLRSAEALAHEALALWQEIGAKTNMAAMLAILGTLRSEQGDLGGAATLLQESRALSEQLADHSGLADVWIRLGQLAHLGVMWEDATAAYQQSLRISLAMDSTAGVPDALEGLAAVLHRQGERERAYQLYAFALDLRARCGAARAPYNERWVAPLRETLQTVADAQHREATTEALALLTTPQVQRALAELALNGKSG
jgi:tetratricopeptide (TPR) repeat protein